MKIGLRTGAPESFGTETYDALILPFGAVTSDRAQDVRLSSNITDRELGILYRWSD
jgi:hypothetical protein